MRMENAKVPLSPHKYSSEVNVKHEDNYLFPDMDSLNKPLLNADTKKGKRYHLPQPKFFARS